MKYLIITFLSLLSFTSEDFRKTKFPYYSIIGGSDLIVQGRIKEKVQIENYLENFIGYKFIIDEKIKSDISKDEIFVKTFKKWASDPRDYSKMKIDQEFLLFLTQTGNGYYEVINGGRGEISTNINKIRADNGYYDFHTFKNGVKQITKHFVYQGPLNPSKDDNEIFTRIKGTKQSSDEESNIFYRDFVKYIKKLIVE